MYENLKKKFGQNFLIDKNIQKKIISLIPKKNLNIIEIGPGDGRLTEEIVYTKPKTLIIIEIDKDLIPKLESKFLKNEYIKIVNIDIMNFCFDKNTDLIISNLPYNISSQILIKICSNEYLPNNLIFMFQKEFALRLIDKKLNSLNSLISCFYDVSFNFHVSKNCFRPIPKIDSTVLSFSKKNKFLLKKDEISGYIEFKRKLFSHKRKSLKNILKKYNFLKEDFDLSRRVEDLSLNELLQIFKSINP